jgi:4-aminobutyrate aminotransferase
MTRIAPVDEPVTFFANSGTETIEAALKLARYVTGRPRFIGFLGGFHGRSMGALAFTSSKYTQQAGFFPTMPGVTHVPFPNPYRPLFVGNDQGAAVLAYIEQLFRHNLPADEVAAIVIEPIQGEGGYLVPPDGFLQGTARALRQARHPARLRRGAVRDRTHGEDVRVRALGRATGHRDGGEGARVRHADRAHGRVQGAHGQLEARRARQYLRRQSVCAAAASATLRVVERELRANAARAGERFMTKLRGLMQRYDVIGDVRGKGLMIGMELVEDRASKRPAPALAEALIRQAFQNGLLLLTCGVSTVRFMPPLVVSDAIVDEASTSWITA